MMILVAWKQSHSFSFEQIDFLGSNIVHAFLFWALQILCIVKVNFCTNSLSDKALWSNVHV